MSEAVEARLSRMDDEMLSVLESKSKVRTSLAFDVAQIEPQEGPDFLIRLHTFRLRQNVRVQILDEITGRNIGMRTQIIDEPGRENDSEQVGMTK